YRFCWLRDATMTLQALSHAGYRAEAAAWRDWLLRAAAGMPEMLQPLYGITGEHWLDERHLNDLPGLAGSRPVRVGNNAYKQLQLDVYGEILDAMHQARQAGLPPEEASWNLQWRSCNTLSNVGRNRIGESGRFATATDNSPIPK